MSDNTKKVGTCGCGRSPTGNCIGWHKLTEEEYAAKLKEEANKKKDDAK